MYFPFVGLQVCEGVPAIGGRCGSCKVAVGECIRCVYLSLILLPFPPTVNESALIGYSQCIKMIVVQWDTTELIGTLLSLTYL
jgi:hypothetical protein